MFGSQMTFRPLRGSPQWHRRRVKIFEMRFALSRSAPVQVFIHNVAGMRVRQASLGSLPAGEHRWVWDGKVQSGASASTGVYLFVLKAGDVIEQRKAVLLK